MYSEVSMFKVTESEWGGGSGGHNQMFRQKKLYKYDFVKIRNKI